MKMSVDIGGSTTEKELAKMPNMTLGIEPIGVEEYRSRIARAQDLMRRHNVDALYIDAGTSLNYFTGVSWYPSERMAGAILPAQGALAYIVPAFERGTFHGMMQIEGRINCWHEHEDPYLLFARVLAESGLAHSTLALDEVTPFFRYNGIRGALQGANLISGTPITNGCRSRKSAAEIALMQRANDITLAVHRAAARVLRTGISTHTVKEFINDAHKAAGGGGSHFCIVLFGPDTAFPHGVRSPKTLSTDDMVLIDTGCKLHGYCSDITRSYSFGEPSARQREVWHHEQQAQRIAFETATIGRPCGQVDDAMRAYVVAQGYGPEYELPGVPHRTGHGIGMDVHESPNLVGNDRTPLAEGMCFSVEPMICVPGEFGVRHEDHIYMTAGGPKWFTQPALSIDDPFGNM
jgi:Xaa-Pro dipeptidase